MQKVKSLINTLLDQKDLIPIERQLELEKLATIIQERLDKSGQLDMIVICTHNSRRSHLGQLWIKTASWHFGIPGIRSYSGGVEVTAFNDRMVAAVERAGFPIRKIDFGENPKYIIPLAQDHSDYDIHYSKVYHDSYNPQKDFIAVIVCSSADAECPNVLGSLYRVFLPYEDPKEYDGTDQEQQAYDDKIKEIGREFLYLFSLLSD